MNKFLRSSGIVFSMLLLVSVSATAQVKKKAVVRKTTTARTVKVADLSCFDLKGKVHTCIVWSNAGGEKASVSLMPTENGWDTEMTQVGTFGKISQACAVMPKGVLCSIVKRREWCRS